MVINCPRCGELVTGEKCRNCGWPQHKSLTPHRAMLRRAVRQALERLNIRSTDIFISTARMESSRQSRSKSKSSKGSSKSGSSKKA